MEPADWLFKLDRLLAAHQRFGIGADVAALSLCELWGVYCYLRRIVGE